ncbi:hypothetical protein WM07_30015 [Burkholderia ubonensis]|nr:hypothetical protein WM07_30015 [Burkholderia ubonensis]
MLEIGAGVRHLGMQLCDMPLVLARPLRFRQLVGRTPAEPVIGQFLAGRKCGEVFQAEVDADAGTDRARRNIGYLDHDVQKPVAACILREVGAVLDLAFGKRSAVEHPEGVAGKAKRVTLALQVAALQRHPAQRLPAAIAQVWAAVLAARFRVLLTRGIDVPEWIPSSLLLPVVSTFRSKPVGHFLFHLSACFCVSLQKFHT